MEPTTNCPQLPDASSPGRRSFLRWLTGVSGAVAGALLGIPLVGYFFAPRGHEAKWVTLGPVDDFPLNATRKVLFDSPLGQPWDGMTSRTGVYVRNQGHDEKSGEQFLVLSVNCAHLGCPVEWFPQSGLFMCPCHGGVYYATGERASGPPPRGMFHCVWRVENGKLLVRAPHFPTLQDTLTETA